MSTGPPVRALSDLPMPELIRYGKGLGLNVSARTERGELLRVIRRRQELLLEIDREALLDVVIWAGRPVRARAGKETLAAEIAQIHDSKYEGLSRRGLIALARLREAIPQDSDTDEQLAEKIVKSERLWDRLRRRRREMLGDVLEKVIRRPPRRLASQYQFLPDAEGGVGGSPGGGGLVGGIARRIKGAADDYIDAKLDEIEERLDTKLDDIDERLAEWRDREIANRLKIIRITLVAAVVVALISLGYSALKRGLLDEAAGPPPAEQTTDMPAAGP